MLSTNNTTSTASADPLGRTKVQIGFEVFFAIAICLISALGNCLVVYVVNKDPQLRNITNVFIQNLAWTDICMGVLYMPFWIISLYTGRWIFSDKLCKAVAAMLYVFIGTSVFNMGVISLNRYLKVVKPTYYRKVFPGRRVAHFYCLASWLIAAVLATPPLYGWGASGFQARYLSCTIVWEIEHISYNVIIAGVIGNSFTVMIFYCYYKIYRTVKKTSANVTSHAQENVTTHVSRNRNIKLMQTTFTVVCVYFLLWVPPSLVVLCETLFGNPAPRLVDIVITYFTFCSSGANPVIYGAMNPQFKRAFAKVLRWA